MTNMNKKNTESSINKLHSFALYSMILGFLSFLFGFFTGIPSIIYGHLFLFKCKKKSNTVNSTYKRMAIGGLIFAYSGMLTFAILLLLIISSIFNWDIRLLLQGLSGSLLK